MSSDKSSRSSSHIPPPTDPYARYATPYERHPSDDDHNPFIEFRRFADKQFSNMFGGFNKMLGVDERNKHMDDIREDLRRSEDLMKQIQEDLRNGIGEEQKKMFEQMFRDFIKPNQTSDLKSAEETTTQAITNQPVNTDTQNSTPPDKEVLPQGWESKLAKNGRRYYVDHNERTTTWEKPESHEASQWQRNNTNPATDEVTQDLNGPDTELDVYERMDELKKADERAEMWKRGFKNCPELKDEEDGEDDKARRRAEMWRRGFRNCPGLREEQADAEQRRAEMWRRGFKNCPGLQDDHSSEQPIPHKERKRSSWLPTLGLGYDGQRRLQQVQKTSDASTQTHSIPKTYTSRDTHTMDPLTEPAHLIPWLFMSSYSPFILAHPHQNAISSMKVQDDGTSPVEVLEPRFSHERSDSAFAEALSRHLDWSAAFEDLLNLNRTGQMDDKSETRSEWFPGVILHGDAGDRWLSNAGRKSDRKWVLEQWSEANNEKDQEASHDVQVSTTSNPQPFEPAFQPIFGIGLPSSAFPSPEEVIAAVHRAEELSKSTQRLEEVTDSFTESPSNQEIRPQSESHSWTTTSKTSYNSSTDEQPSVVSTLTKTTSRTLPDGSVETKRVLKKKFADGREEKEESVDVTPFSTNRLDAASSINQDTSRRAVTAGEEQQETKQGKRDTNKKPGWFWL